MAQINLLDQILDDQEKLAVQMFMDNSVQREAVKKCLLAPIYHNGVLKKGKVPNPTMNFTLGLAANKVDLKLTNEQIGADLVAKWEGIAHLETAFSNMAKFRQEKVAEKSKENPAI